MDYTIDLNTIAINMARVHHEPVTTTRRYDSPLRTAQAEQTRRRVVDAGSRLLAEKGWVGTSMREVEREAGSRWRRSMRRSAPRPTCSRSPWTWLSWVTTLRRRWQGEPIRRLGEGTLDDRLAATAGLMAEINRRGAALHRVFEEGARSEPQLRDALR